MNVRIFSRDFELTPAIEARVLRQVERSLQSFERELTSVEAYLSDINGPRGGADKKVLMRTALPGLPPVSVSTEHADLYVAIGRTAKRLRRAVKRSITKNQRVEPRKVYRLRRLSLQSAAG